MPATPAWMDFALYMQGMPPYNYIKICNDMWKHSSVKTEQLPADIETFLDSIPKKEYSSVRVRVSDWVKYRNQV